MKKFFVDLSFVFLFVFFILSFMNDFISTENQIDQEIEQFELYVQQDEKVEVVEDVYVGYQEDNIIGMIVKGVSNICVGLIEGFFIIISNFFAILL